jgi:superfamily II DNA or RNA helicase
MATPEAVLLPQVGMLASVRNRIGWIAHVDAHSGHSGTRHLARIEYLDHHGATDDTLIWESEPRARVWPPSELPPVISKDPMPTADFRALARASRWSATAPFLDPGSLQRSEHAAMTAPVFGAVEIDDFQLVPLLKALAMPRVSLLLADDVGLGKTIEAGLVLHELLIRRRIRRVLIITPASLKLQWQQEMNDKFSLRFNVVDRDETQKLRSKLGPDSNPWRANSRAIASYHYLKQPDILDDFLTTCAFTGQSPQAQLPWDLLIVDECHNLMPSSFSGRDSDLAMMLRQITPYFEHKLFLTATPHNGHTRCFSGLLEQLDPVRFTQTTDFEPDQKARIPDVVVRRLKREIIDYDHAAGRVPRFSPRIPKPLPLFFTKAELALNRAVEEFRKAVHQFVLSQQSRQEQLAGSFAVEVLSKRVLSCPFTFADSWRRFQQGAREGLDVDAAEVNAAAESIEDAATDDREKETRSGHAVRTVGAWLRPMLDDLAEEIAAVDAALEKLGLTSPAADPRADARFERLCGLIDEHLRQDKHWRSDERLIVFSEFKTTVDYLERRLKDHYGDEPGKIRTLFGGDTSLNDREEIKAAFNDPDDPVRVLIATDVASEGLNLQETARLLLHFEVPWNPSRLEQRNGRLDRHGQARDVLVHHFTSDDDADLRFLSRVAEKIDAIREDLGSVNDVFDAAFQRRFQDQVDADEVLDQIDKGIDSVRGSANVEREQDLTNGEEALQRLNRLRAELDLTPESLRQTLDVALRMEAGRNCLEGPDATGRMRVTDAPAGWKPTVVETLQRRNGAKLSVVFDPKFFLHNKNGRVVFRPLKDTRLVHLGHPLFRHALSAFARRRFGSGDQGATRWTVTRGPVPEGAQALFLLDVEEIAVNELRESVHHWVRPVRLPWDGDKLLPELPHTVVSAADQSDTSDVDTARDIWMLAEEDLRDWIEEHRKRVQSAIELALKQERETALKEEKERFRVRIREVERQMKENTLEKLQKELDKLLKQLSQLALWEEEERKMKQMRASDLVQELEIRRGRYGELKERLEREEKRVTGALLPLRYKLRPGGVQAFPVTAEIRLPEVAR